MLGLKPELKGMALTLAGSAYAGRGILRNIGIVYLFGFVLVTSGAMVRARPPFRFGRRPPPPRHGRMTQDQAWARRSWMINHAPDPKATTAPMMNGMNPTPYE